MKYSYNWLKELSGTKKSPKELADLLARRAFELEEMKNERKETQLELAILPNRGHDALSHIGMAREICAAEGRKFKFLMSNIKELLKSIARQKLNFRKLEIKVENKKLCPRYIGTILENVKVESSPQWLQEKLWVCGVRPINNIVDITNYVMLETGQPLHAFDLEKIESEFPISNFQFPNKSQLQITSYKLQIIVRKAKKGEKVKLLDEKEYVLGENDLVIADVKKVLALAGVMGGLDSSVSEKTTAILLEAANFNPTGIRKTRIRHGILTESSYRFERELDPNLAEAGMARAIELIRKIGGENIKITALTDVYPKKVKPWRVKLDPDYVNCLLGEKIPAGKMKNILENLGLKILGNLVSKWIVEIPTFRIDLKTQEDLIEEIGRIYGYENIKEQPLKINLSKIKRNKKRDFENKLRDILVSLGFSEVMNYSFYGADDITKCNLKVEDHIKVANPLSLDQQYLRSSLAPNILKNASLNLKNFSQVQIFEIGNCFFWEKAKSREKAILAGTLTDKKEKSDLFFELKGKTEALLDNLGYKNSRFLKSSSPILFWHPTRTAEIEVEGKKIGRIGEVNPKILREYGIKSRLALFEIQLSELLEKVGYPQEKAYQPISKFPVVERDLSMFIGEEVSYADLQEKILRVGGKLILGVDLFDVFEKEGRKSLAIRLKIGSDKKTLTSEEVEAVMKKIISVLEKDLKVKVRK